MKCEYCKKDTHFVAKFSVGDLLFNFDDYHFCKVCAEDLKSEFKIWFSQWMKEDV